MKYRNDLTAEYLRSRLDYDPDTGTFTWKSRVALTRDDRMWNARYGGRIAGYEHEGYWEVGIDGHMYKAHRLAFLWMTGEWPVEEIDHHDKQRLNNAWSNLRSASHSENRMNISVHENNACGLKGVSRPNKYHTKHGAHIGKNGKQYHLGYFNTKDEAAAAYAEASARLHGEFGRVS